VGSVFVTCRKQRDGNTVVVLDRSGLSPSAGPCKRHTIQYLSSEKDKSVHPSSGTDSPTFHNLNLQGDANIEIIFTLVGRLLLGKDVRERMASHSRRYKYPVSVSMEEATNF